MKTTAPIVSSWAELLVLANQALDAASPTAYPRSYLQLRQVIPKIQACNEKEDPLDIRLIENACTDFKSFYGRSLPDVAQSMASSVVWCQQRMAAPNIEL